jgi:TolB-like protein
MPGDTASETFRVGDFTLDLAKGVLLRDNRQVVLRPKAQTLLTHLARNTGRIVPKAELMDIAWPGIFVTEDSLTQSIREIRKALGDDAQALIRTVARRGYMLPAAAEPPGYAAEAPVVAVLRFRNESGDGSQDAMVDGFTEEVIDGLARFKTVTVLARHSSFAVSADGPDGWTKVRERIGADYIVEGAVRRSRDSLRVSVRLIDAQALTQYWADRYEAATAECEQVERQIVEQIISRLASRLDVAGASKAQRKSPAELAAQELMLRGIALIRSNNPAEFKLAQRLLEESVARDPAYGLAHAHLAFAKVTVAGFGRAKRPDLEEALKTATRAIELSPDQPVAHRVISFVEMYLRDYAAAEYHLRRALDLNPYDAENVEQMGYLMALRGRPVEALDWIDRATRLNPIHPPWYDHDRAFALYCLGEYRAAATAIERTPVLPAWMRTWLAACYAQMGDLEAARFHAAQIVEADPDFSAVSFARDRGAAFEHAADNDHFAEGVFLALGLPA